MLLPRPNPYSTVNKRIIVLLVLWILQVAAFVAYQKSRDDVRIHKISIMAAKFDAVAIQLPHNGARSILEQKAAKYKQNAAKPPLVPVIEDWTLGCILSSGLFAVIGVWAGRSVKS